MSFGKPAHRLNNRWSCGIERLPRISGDPFIREFARRLSSPESFITRGRRTIER